MASPAVAVRAAEAIPPLNNGDVLAREEFRRRWDLHPEIKRAERIDGIVYAEMVVGPDHGAAHIIVAMWAGMYAHRAAGVEAGDNVTVRLPADDVQPDVLLRRTDSTASRRSSSGIDGPPEFVFEVAATSAAYDLHQKRRAYERGGVPEYVVWEIFENRLEWFQLVEGRYIRREPDADGIIESIELPGLRLHVPSLLARDVRTLLDRLG
ncbi:MAG: Uma2 family endonuclease [Dehalococcoidia bacterium]